MLTTLVTFAAFAGPLAWAALTARLDRKDVGR
jgi:hypothetical protein